MSLKKAEVLMRTLKEKLGFRLPAMILTDSRDVSGNPVLTVAADAAWNTGDEWATIKIKPVDQIGVNSIGQAQESFSPHVCQLVAEESAAAGVSYLKDTTSMALEIELKALGCILELYLSAITDEPNESEIVDANLKARYDDIVNPLTSSM